MSHPLKNLVYVAAALAVLATGAARAAEPGPLLVTPTSATVGNSGVGLVSFAYAFDPGLGVTDISFVSFDTALVYDTTHYALNVASSSLTYGNSTYSLADAVNGLGLGAQLISEQPDANTFTSRTATGVDVNLPFSAAKINLAFDEKPGTTVGSTSNVFFTFNYAYHDPNYGNGVLFTPQPLQAIATLTAGPVAAVPETSTLLMMALGVAGLIVRRRQAGVVLPNLG